MMTIDHGPGDDDDDDDAHNEVDIDVSEHTDDWRTSKLQVLFGWSDDQRAQTGNDDDDRDNAYSEDNDVHEIVCSDNDDDDDEDQIKLSKSRWWKVRCWLCEKWNFDDCWRGNTSDGDDRYDYSGVGDNYDHFVGVINLNVSFELTKAGKLRKWVDHDAGEIDFNIMLLLMMVMNHHWWWCWFRWWWR